AGSPVVAQVEGERGILARFAGGPIRSGATPSAVDYDHGRLPPEVQVERESVRVSHLRFAIDSACLLMRMLQAAGASGIAEALRTTYRLAMPLVEQPDVDREAADWMSIAGAGLPDARAIAGAVGAQRGADGT